MISTESTETVFKAFEDQDRFVEAVFSGLYKYPCFGGSIRSGKTYICLAALIMLCKIFPQSRWVVIRKDLPTIKRTTLPSFFKLCPTSFLADFNRSEFIARMTNLSEIMFMQEMFEYDPELNRFKGLEVNGFLLEQVEELHEKTFYMCIQRAGQWKLDPMPPNIIMANCNPTPNWPKRLWYDSWKNGTLEAPFYFQEADIFRNPYMSEDYLKSLKTLPPELYKRFIENAWESIDALDQLVPWEDIYGCKDRIESADETMSLGVDVGRKGPDPTVFVLLKGPNIVKIESYPKTLINEVDEKTEKLMLEHHISADHVCVDAVGLGAGVVDNLEKRKYRVIAMEGGNQKMVRDRLVGTHFKFLNWKAWSYWIAAEEIKKHCIGNFTNDILKSDAGAIWYFIRGDKEIHVESKENLRKRIGRSCDYWDAFVYAVWAYKQQSIVPQASIYTRSMYEQEMKVAEVT